MFPLWASKKKIKYSQNKVFTMEACKLMHQRSSLANFWMLFHRFCQILLLFGSTESYVGHYIVQQMVDIHDLKFWATFGYNYSFNITNHKNSYKNKHKWYRIKLCCEVAKKKKKETLIKTNSCTSVFVYPVEDDMHHPTEIPIISSVEQIQKILDSAK